MDKKLWKEVLLGIAAILVFFMATLAGTTIYQLIPFFVYGGLAVADLKGKNIKVWMLILSIFMAIVNLLIPSIPDVIFWGVVVALYV